MRRRPEFYKWIVRSFLLSPFLPLAAGSIGYRASGTLSKAFRQTCSYFTARHSRTAWIASSRDPTPKRYMRETLQDQVTVYWGHGWARKLTSAVSCFSCDIIVLSDPLVSIGVYAVALFVLGFGEAAGDIVVARHDDVGLLLDAEVLLKRVRPKKVATAL